MEEGFRTPASRAERLALHWKCSGHAVWKRMANICALGWNMGLVFLCLSAGHAINWLSSLGDICSVTVLGQPLIILNSAKAVIDILEKKSAIYSDRPTLHMGGELVGWKNTLVLLQYGDRFRRYRRLFHKLIGSQAAMKAFLPIEELEARRFLRRVLMKPEDLAAHIRK